MTKPLCVALALLAFACTVHAAPAGKPGGGAKPTPEDPVSPTARKPATRPPEERARAIMEAQLKALPGDNAALRGTFAKGAVVVLPHFVALVDDPSIDLAAQVARMNPHAQMKSAKLGSLVAGGNDSMVWFAAELEIVVASSEPGESPSTETHAIRVVELAEADSAWKVVAGAFTEVRALGRRREPKGPLPSATAPGPLVSLLAAPERLSSSLANDPVIVFGTDASERAVGQPAAKALLARWGKLPLAIEEVSKVREVRSGSWAYAIASVNLAKPGGAPYRMSAFLIAQPAPGSTWSVVAVNYGAL